MNSDYGIVAVFLAAGCALGLLVVALAPRHILSVGECALSPYHYVQPIARMYLRPPDGSSGPAVAPALGWAIGLSLAVTILAGLLLEPLVAPARAGAGR